MTGEAWFRTLLDASPDIYFRYTLAPRRRFAYVSPAVQTLTGHRPEAFCADSRLCVALVPREDRAALRQMARARRGLVITLRLRHAAGCVVPLEIRSVPVIQSRHLVAVEGVARLAPAVMPPAGTAVRTSSPGANEPVQPRLAALLYEVHNLLHAAAAGSGIAGCPAGGAASDRTLRIGDIVLDPDRLSVTAGGTPVALTTRELLVLRYLLQHRGRVVTRQQLLTEVWGYRYTGDARTVDVHMSRLRAKLPALRDRLVTLKHMGYRLDQDVESLQPFENVGI